LGKLSLAMIAIIIALLLAFSVFVIGL